MAISRNTQKDIGNYEAKLIGPFTTRQCIFVGVGLVPSFFIGYSLFTTKMDVITILFVIAIIMAPFLFFAFAHPYGMKPETFLREYYIYHILAPAKRLYVRETFDDGLEKEQKKQQSLSNNKKENRNQTSQKTTHKKDKDYPDFL